MATDKEEKQWAYRIEQIKHELEMEKLKSASLEADNADLKKQMVSGETRNQKIKRIQNLVDELKEQLSEKE